jgi:phosphatidylserine decarboxylase
LNVCVRCGNGSLPQRAHDDVNATYRKGVVPIYPQDCNTQPRLIRDGYFYALSFVLVSVLVYGLTGSRMGAVVPLPLAAFFLWFFRNPRRKIPQAPGLVVSPADGKVTEIAAVITPEGRCIRISIFLSVFDVHVNRAPISGVLKSSRYQKGEFLNAMNPHSAVRNEQQIAVMEGPDGTQVTFKVMAGLLARRIVFHPQEGQHLERGQLVGMIKFGSRCDVLLPEDAVLLVKRGEHVRGGATALARL